MTATGIYYVNASGLTLPGVPAASGGTATGRVLRRGEEFEVTPELYAETLDRNGESWLDLTPEEQTRRYGHIKFLPGTRPDDIAVGDDDEGYRYKQGLAAREYAQQISDPAERAAALAEVSAEYGSVLRPIAQTSTGF
ncbi:hypothetical protein [Microbacterium sp. ProA8]|uniref:hypothetical protein n=1 Tax=Microbacterium chionoecetis TaxID=3153754 RepID=UPI0032643982